MKNIYSYFQKDMVTGKSVLQTTDNPVKANNEAYWSGSEVTITNLDGVTKYTPYRVITSNLIDGGFHNPTVRNNT